MKKQNYNVTDIASLRRKAEERLKKLQSKSGSVSSEADLLRLIHELEVHQIELEMQNEELIGAKEKIEELAKEKYKELYDFAPLGYISLAKDGIIKELNFIAAKMLGKERLYLVKKRFIFFVSIDTQTTFNIFLQEVFTSKIKQTCEVIIETEDNLPMYINVVGIVSQDDEFCFLTLVDITERIKAEQELIALKKQLEIKVEERTKELKERVTELERLYNATIDRELRMKELRDEIKRLKGDI